ncbi:sporulation protein [Streptomyces fructofermentans]|uniref:sporulation protein n=1 Tax=Streptomyces fructofermentans TaxID=152141 RepID=UPI00341195B9
MAFKRLLAPLGVGGPTVDTLLDAGAARPGGTLSGRVRLRGGGADLDIEHVTLELVAGAGDEHEGSGDSREAGEAGGSRESGEAGEAPERRGGGEHARERGARAVVFGRIAVGGGLRLAAGAEHAIPFRVALPWETPVTELYGRDLGIALGVRTEVSAGGERDRGGPARLDVGPLPVQEAVTEALGRLGFGFRSAHLEPGRVGGTGQQLPFRQELELTPSAAYAHAVNEIELTFLAGPAGTEVVLEADKRGGPLSSADDALARFTVPHEGVGRQDWSTLVDGWIRQLVEHREAYVPDAAYGHDGPRQHAGAGGRGVSAPALAAGPAGGLSAAVLLDEAGDFFESGPGLGGAEG